jgi:ribosome-binding factor A
MADGQRVRRIGDQIQRELAELIRDSVRDPRIGRVTVSGVEVSRDLAHARVYVTVLGAEAEESRNGAALLQHAAPFLRRELAKRMRLRMVPQLHIAYDPSFDRGAYLGHLIDSAIRHDETARERAGPDPDVDPDSGAEPGLPDRRGD